MSQLGYSFHATQCSTLMLLVQAHLPFCTSFNTALVTELWVFVGSITQQSQNNELHQTADLTPFIPELPQ